MSYAERIATIAPGSGVAIELMPHELYLEVEAMSGGGAKKILQSPEHFLLWRTRPNDPTEAMEFGTAVHCGVLEPDSFDARICVAPSVDRRTKEGKARRAEFVTSAAGKLALDADAFDRARRCIDRVNAHPAAKMLLAGAERELSLFWRDGRYDVPCKARFDARNHGGIVELKTTRDASPEEFAKTIANLLYHVSAAHYFSGAEHVLNETPAFFAFIAVESEPPHSVACYSLPGNAILAGAHLMNKALARYRDALVAGEFRGYPDTVEQITLPRWATTFA